MKSGQQGSGKANPQKQSKASPQRAKKAGTEKKKLSPPSGGTKQLKRPQGKKEGSGGLLSGLGTQSTRIGKRDPNTVPLWCKAFGPKCTDCTFMNMRLLFESAKSSSLKKTLLTAMTIFK